ncbi:MAG TPA: AAA family ATPase [Ignavibacteria bacterium]|nr:dephospho-CoA kinase [Bacteroidota bacterium]HRE09372.1 AAA family ATPase [Ignavibacteria bacterium]HRF64498.1 AAA family ATPase [Ignavibacteria bacterium]HRJ04879.1 AAA family ATPase [Ignavibacteria bacterium]HRJ84867.1 AAA family ATPase [Ignavibacteria bacterium]
MNKIIAVVGMCGSGKSEAVKFFVESGYRRVYFGEVVMNEMKRLGLEVNEANERATRENLRKEFGMGAMAVKSLPIIEEFMKHNNVVIESLYSWEEFKILKDKFGESFKLITIYTTKDLRYERLLKRPFRPLTNEESKSRDISEIEKLDKGGPIAYTDYLIMNDGSFDEMNAELKKYV